MKVLGWITFLSLTQAAGAIAAGSGRRAFDKFIAYSVGAPSTGSASESDVVTRVYVIKAHKILRSRESRGVFRADVSYEIIGERHFDERSHRLGPLRKVNRKLIRSYTMRARGRLWILDPPTPADQFLKL